MQREEAYAQALKEQEEFERQEREYRAAEAAKAEADEREEREKERREIIDKLETSDKDASKLIAKQRKRALERSSQRTTSTMGSDNLSRLLRTRSKANTTILDVPHVPLQDNWDCYESKISLKVNGYDDFFSDAVRKDREGIMRAGGYRVEEAWERALRFAVAGLDLMPISDADTNASLAPSVGVDGDVVMAS